MGYYEDHREEILERRKVYYLANRDRIRAAAKAYYNAHADEVIARASRWNRAHRSLRRARQRKGVVGSRMVCMACGRTVSRRTANQLYCRRCQPEVRAYQSNAWHKEQRREAA